MDNGHVRALRGSLGDCISYHFIRSVVGLHYRAYNAFVDAN